MGTLSACSDFEIRQLQNTNCARQSTVTGKMQKERFGIGEKEKHFFAVDWDKISKRIKIEQDGVIVANEPRSYSPLKEIPV